VRESEQRGVEMTVLPFASFVRAHPRFEQDVYESLSAAFSVTQRESDGGTGPVAVRAQLAAARNALLPPPTPRSSNAAI
jgi:argininosuccinate lyase